MQDMTTYGSGTGPRAQQAQRDAAERERLAEDLARWAGEEAEAAHDADVAAMSEGRHYTYCCEHAREDGARNEYAFAMEIPLDMLRRRHASTLQERIAGLATIEPPAGWQQRAEDRARRDGVLP